MIVDQDKVVFFHCSISENDAIVEQSPDEPLAYIHGHRALIKGLERAMTGRRAGDRFSVTLPPELAYGYRQEAALRRVPRKHVRGKGKLKPGDSVIIDTHDGAHEARVIKAGKFMLEVDGNHPLAGKTLTFEVEIVNVREAEAAEIAHGHVHGDGGHRH